MLLHMEILTSLKAFPNADFQSWRLLRAWKKTLAQSVLQFKLRCSNLPNYQGHSDGTNSGSTAWCPTSSISLHLWWLSVKDSLISRKHSPPACLNERSALGLELPEALLPDKIQETERKLTGFHRSLLGQRLWSESAAGLFSCASSWGACEDLEKARSPLL